MSIDWKAVAAKRLRALRDADQRMAYLRSQIYDHAQRALVIELHARGIGSADEIASRVADSVATRMTD